ncbi:hypothetical protein EIP91_002694 [Steccherinum ochraceum]|uniref:Fungal-type protein kinase domain-containing protein n=1 Tax=Steccherinum ochraceum TaxID=92696 RepID=A0A4R0RNK4_9APHY|nr:hypothetical protein EIP91_002694 [Steccherinum ochraceum]
MATSSKQGVSRTYLVQKPLSAPTGLRGRATRVFIAFDVDSGDLVCIKDYWRPSDPARPAEADVYEFLAAARVPHLLRLRLGGDVLNDDGSVQSSLSQAWDGKAGVPSTGALYHHRIVQDIAYPLITVKNSRELVAAIRNSAECVIAARSCSWLHQDVSGNNAMIDEEGRGILNDWDHAVRVAPDEKVMTTRRIGTWQFLSAALATTTKKPHTIFDDLESCFWVLYYFALHKFSSNAVSQDTTIFDDYYPYLEHSQLVGGTQKSVLFWGPEGRISFETVPLQHVVEGLRQYFRRYYIFHVYDTEMDGIRKSGPEMLKIFDEALANLDWPADDACKDLFAPASTSAS